MLWTPKPLCKNTTLPVEELKADKKAARNYYDCALGNKAVYLGWFLFSNVHYIPLTSVERVFKRLSVSKGFYETDKVYGTLPYLVVKYNNGQERVCRFRKEADVDKMLCDFAGSTNIPVGKV
jgi:hypothetical protein